MPSNPLHDELLRQAVEALKNNDRATAMERAEEVLAEDNRSVRALSIVARAAPTNDARLKAAERILALDPYNEFALKVQERLGDGQKQEEVAAGISRRVLNLVIGAIVGAVVFTLLGVGTIVLGNLGEERAIRQNATNTAAVQTRALLARTESVYATETAAAGATRTAFLTISPTPTATFTPAITLPPSRTLTPTPDLSTSTPLPAPLGLPGQIYGFSGTDLRDNQFLNIVAYPMGGGVPQVLVANNARYPTSTDGSTLIYTRLFQPGGAADFYRLEQLAPDGTTTTDLTMAWASYESIDSTDQAYIAPGGDQMVFVGRAADTASVQVYLFSLSGEAIGSGGSPIARLTNDSADYSDPALSPDGRQVVAVRTWNEGDLIGPDLVTINVTNRIQTALTNDGGATIEAMPRFSPDGSAIVFAAGAPNAPRDLYLIATQGVTTAPLLQTDFDEMLPVYSPDGGFIAFSSDRYGSYDVFVFDVSTRALLQLTFSAEDDYATLWLP